MAKTRAHQLSSKSKGTSFLSGMGYKGVLRRGSKYGWKYEDGKISRSQGGFDTAEEAAYDYDEFLIAYIGPDADTNQALGFLKLKTVLEIREKIRKAERPRNKADKRSDKIGATGYRGVSANNSKKKPFKAQIYINGKYVHIGTYPTAEEAARAYDLFVLQHTGAKAVTNVSLGLLPPVGDKVACAEVVRTALERAKKVEVEEEEKQPDFNDNNPAVIPPFLPTFEDLEREAQIKAARAMAANDGDDTEDLAHVPEVEAEVGLSRATPQPVDNLRPTGEESPAAALMPQGELIVMSRADKLRNEAQRLLAEAAEVEAGDIKRKAQERINVLTGAVKAMQDSMLKLIDTCAEIETELTRLSELL